MLSAPAAQAQAVDFRGGGYIANFWNCGDVATGAGNIMPVTARYEPGELEGNDDASLTVSHGFAPYAFNLRRPNAPFESTWARVRGIHLIASPQGWDARPRVRILRQQPSVLTEATQRMRVTVLVRHMFNIQGCRAEIDLDLLRQ